MVKKLDGYTVKNGKVVKVNKADNGSKFPALNISPETANTILEIAKSEGIEPSVSTKGEGKDKPIPASLKAIVHGVIDGIIASFVSQKAAQVKAFQEAAQEKAAQEKGKK